VRPTPELADLRYSFTQEPLLLPEQFVEAMLVRGVELTTHELEDLHRIGLLVPLVRLARSRAQLQQASREPWVWNVVLWNPTSPPTVAAARGDGLLTDPASERFVPAARRQRQHQGGTIASSVMLYSPYQTIYAPLIQQVRSFVVATEGKARRVRLKAPWRFGELWLGRARHLRDLVVAASALEAMYLPSVRGLSRVDADADANEFEEWRHRRPPKQVLGWLGVKPDWLTASAAQLLRRADEIDPLGRWHEVIAHADPDMWEELRGNARIALDMRIAAELLLRYYDRLVEARQARGLTKSTSRERGLFDRRLRPSRTLDEVLTNFGLSPHPRLVLVVEGETEFALMPRVLSLLLTKRDEDVITFFNAEGTRSDLRPLTGLVAPRLAQADQGARHVGLLRPMTRVLVVFDAEHPVATDAKREERRQSWVDRMLRALPQEHRTTTVRQQLDRVVQATTWNSKGENFEFAHFTPLQLAKAIVAMPGHRRPPDLTKTRKLVLRARDEHINLKSLVPGRSKTRLAEELWPLLERRIVTAIEKEKETEKRIPIVRVLDEAIALAYEFPRRGLVIRIDDAERTSTSSASGDAPDLRRVSGCEDVSIDEYDHGRRPARLHRRVATCTQSVRHRLVADALAS
jgi:hypothetical protein